MENNLETNTKKYITSLLTSTPLVVTLHQLSKDYTNTIGEPIPYQRLGYNSLEHFLRSITDTVNVRGSGGTAEIIPVVSKKSAHVYTLVSNQKLAKPRRRQYGHPRRRTTSYVPSYIPPLSSIRTIYDNPKPAPATRKMFYPQVNSSSTASTSSNSTSQPFECRNNNTKTGGFHTKSPEVVASSIPKAPLLNKTIRTESVVETKKQEEKKIDRPNFESQQPKLESKQQTENKIESSTNNESSKCTTNVRNLLKKITPDKNKFCADQMESNVPYNVRSNLRSLIGQCPKGIWCAEVPEKYRKMFRQELNYQELGFRSLIDLCVCLSSIFHYVRPSTEDFKLYDRSRPLPDCAETKFTFASYNVNSIKSPDLETGALPNIDWADVNMFLPKGIFKPGTEIPRAFIPVEMADYELDIDIVIGEIYDLSKFWIYLQHSLLDTLMDSIQEFYKDHALEYQIPEHLMKEGLYCVQIVFGEYHRALIVDVMPELDDTIRVIFIDYGTMTKVPMKGACFLHEDFSHLPAQAIRCRLANIFPLEEGIPWSREASKAFRKMVTNRDMSIKISHINWEDQFLEVFLADVTEEDSIYYINDRLVEEGFAQYPTKDLKQTIVDPLYTPIVKFIHLFPTFLELEHGLAPSTAEMEILNDCDVPINFCYPQYFYVDYAFEEEIIKAAEDFHEKNCMKGKQRAPGRYYDLEQFKSQAPDMSIFGELESEIKAFLTKPAEQAPRQTPSSDEDFVDADEEEFHAKLDVMTEKFKCLSTREEETVNVLKEDLMMTEDIMKNINFLCNYENQSIIYAYEEQSLAYEDQSVAYEDQRVAYEDQSVAYEDQSVAYGDQSVAYDNQGVVYEDQNIAQSKESQNGGVQSNCGWKDYNFQEWELRTIKETSESVESLNSFDYCDEPTDRPAEDSDYDQIPFSNHPLSKLTFEKACSTEGGSSSSNSPQSEHSPVVKNTNYDLQQSDLWLKPINFSFLSTSNTSLGRILANSEAFADLSDGTSGASRKSSKKTHNGNLSNSSDSWLGGSNNKDVTVKAHKPVSTNPFLEDETATTDSSTDLPPGLKLNPNNPFLTFLSNKSEKGTSESSQESSASTTYDSPIVPAKSSHSWSNFDDISPETISQLGRTLSTNSSCDSLRTSGGANNCSIATQTIREQANVLPPYQPGPAPYYGQQPAGPYSNYQNWSLAFANPYYNVRFPNHPGYSYDPAYGAAMPCRPPMGPPGFNPPPGFAPLRPNFMPPYPPRFQQGTTYYPRPDGPRPLPYYGPGAAPQQGAALKFSEVSRTTSVSMSVSDHKDFYEVYNERLKLHVDGDSQ